MFDSQSLYYKTNLKSQPKKSESFSSFEKQKIFY